MPNSPSVDLLLVGGGLANGLIAWRLRHARPDLRLLVLEQDAQPGGNHTWSFHASDLTPAQQAWMEPLVTHAWDSHEVRFPGLTRHFASGYRSIVSGHFAAALRGALDAGLRCGVRVDTVSARAVRLADGTTIEAGAVIDGRGGRPDPSLVLGHQKFLGRELRLEAPHGLRAPVLMDATVAQHDGYRFVYLLPFTADTLLVEDTYYADGPDLGAGLLRARLDAYVAAQGWRVRAVLREERGVLPIVLDGEPAAFWPDDDGPARSGLAAGLFHPTTGYSLPDAVRLADRLAALPSMDVHAVRRATRESFLRQWRDQRFFRMLNRMLFRAAAPDERRVVLRRFYGLSEPLIRRFYAGSPTLYDRLRIVTGRPPVPFGRAVRVAFGPAQAAPSTEESR